MKKHLLTYSRLFPKVSRYMTYESTIINLACRIRRHSRKDRALMSTSNKHLRQMYIQSLINASVLSFDIYGIPDINMFDARQGFIALNDGSEFILLMYSNKYDNITMIYVRIHNINTTYTEFICSCTYDELCNNTKELLGIVNSVLLYNDIDEIEYTDMESMIDMLYKY